MRYGTLVTRVAQEVVENLPSTLDGAVKASQDDTLAAGYTPAAVDDGTKSTGTYKPSPAGGNIRKIINGGSFSFAAPDAAGDYLFR